MAYRNDEAALRARIQELEQRVTQLAQDKRDLMAQTSLLRAQLIAVRKMVPADAATVDASLPTYGTGPVGFHVAGPTGGPFATLRFDLKIIKIGSSETCHIQADDGSMARVHAVVEVSERGAELIDLGSASGTLVNGERVQKKVLAHGDVIQIGSRTFVVDFAFEGNSG